MARTPKKDYIVGLDIGTTKISVIVGEVTGNHKEDQRMGETRSFAAKAQSILSLAEIPMDIVGLGTYPSTGLRKGVVINIDSTVESIRKAIHEAELMAGAKISQVYVGIAGAHIQSFNSHGVVAVKEKEITPSDVARVLDAAKAIAIPTDREIIHVVPQEYIIDDQDGIREPVGMSGVRLEAKVHIVTGAVSAVQNIVKCCTKAGLSVSEIVLEPIASAEAVLSQDEKELGVVLIDIGGGTTDIAIFSGGALVHTQVIPLGGNHVTRDIAVGLRTPHSEAEKIKVRHAAALAAMVSGEENIEVPSVGGRKSRIISRKILAEIIEPRMEEMFQLIKDAVHKSGFQDLAPSGYVFTGGGTMLDGICELGEMIFEMPVKRGLPSGIGGLGDIVMDAKFSTGVGLLKYGAKRRMLSHNRSHRVKFGYEKIRSSMKDWLKELF